MSNIIALLKQEKRISGWRVTENATVSNELFFVHRKLETVRSTDTVDTKVTVYVDHDGKTGDSSFAVSVSMTQDDMQKKIDQAVRRAQLVFNEPYELPQGGFEDTELPTNMKDLDPKELSQQIADAVFRADTVPGGSINACEIFLYRDTVRVRNSRGVDKTQRSWRVMIEAIPTFTDDQQSVELYEDHRFTEFDAEKVTAEIASRMAEVRDRALAKKPETPLKINVILRAEEISDVFDELAYDLAYESVYTHENLHKIGDDLQSGGTGDKLTLTMKAVVPGSELSSSFDEDGTALTDTVVIENGVAKNYFGSSRYGQYLKVEHPSGKLRCMEAAPGAMEEKEMRSAPYIECASLSGLQLDLYNDYIGGEIRLAYYYDGAKTVPITGISMSGKLSQALSSMGLSRETVTNGAYHGPKFLLMRGITVL